MSAGEYYWGRKKYSKNVALYEQLILLDSQNLIQKDIIDKMKY
jgi:hypothetical protein